VVILILWQLKSAWSTSQNLHVFSAEHGGVLVRGDANGEEENKSKSKKNKTEQTV